ncbi:hypothetical protein FD754_025333 [Muntiacus muntjak]|uniref:CN hydrolase domain-containing protein n=1 Tax=Muntiacus muntjak TaxID=9888 RepID=A0A5N3UKK4_MUNMU|nr:hypothetical protein FD754_025333 [Muntiacus muntjak]
MNRNLDLLEGAVTSASKQGAHIIVTPEDGIYGFNFTRESIYPYLEDIPDPQVNWIPCDNPDRDWTWAPCIGSPESWPLDHQGSPI